MSIDSDPPLNEEEFTALARICENNSDDLTDTLVDALYEAFRILEEEVAGDRLH